MNFYLIIIVFILVGKYLLELTVEFLNLKNISYSLPEELEGYLDKDKYRVSQLYLKENTHFKLIKDLIFLIFTLIFIFLGGFNFIDKFARSFNYGEVITGLIFIGILTFFLEILNIPFSIYKIFIIEEKFGFNRTNIKTFILDTLKNWILGALIGGTILAIVIWFFNYIGRTAWFWCWIIIIILQLFLNFIAPIVILPLFNKFLPLEEGEVKKEIEKYLKEQNFNLKGIFKMDASKRSTKTNAFFIGFGKFKKIVLFDTLIQKYSPLEIVAVLSHEVGHYKNRHFIKQLFLSILIIGITLFAFSFFLKNPNLFMAFKMEKVSIYASLVFFSFLYQPIILLFEIIQNTISRNFEYEADRFVISTFKKPDIFINALKKLHLDNLSNLTPHPLKVFLDYTHPPILKRIEIIKSLNNL